MEQNLVQITQGSRDLIRNIFGGVKVACIQADQRLARGRIGHVELV